MNRKKIIIITIFCIFFILFPIYSNASDNEVADSIIASQKASLDVSKFLSQAKKYTIDTFKDTDYGELLNSALIRKY